MLEGHKNHFEFSSLGLLIISEGRREEGGQNYCGKGTARVDLAP